VYASGGRQRRPLGPPGRYAKRGTARARDRPARDRAGTGTDTMDGLATARARGRIATQSGTGETHDGQRQRGPPIGIAKHRITGQANVRTNVKSRP
jgi:hypothetical protein